MPKAHKTASETLPCDFCKSKIQRGEKYVLNTVKDQYGKYKVRHHTHCDHTAELNALAEREGV